METWEAIAGRRSIRRFTDRAVPQEMLDRVLQAGVLAPSGKNTQPWRFVVVDGDGRAEMVRIMREGIAEAKEQGHDPGSSEWTAAVMEKAPVTVFVFNAQSDAGLGGDAWSIVDVQSIGAAIQNMLLAAHDMGLGTLWICDVFYAYERLRGWLGRKEQMIAAVSIGWPDEQPGPRPRMELVEVVTRFGG